MKTTSANRTQKGKRNALLRYCCLKFLVLKFGIVYPDIRDTVLISSDKTSILVRTVGQVPVADCRFRLLYHGIITWIKLYSQFRHFPVIIPGITEVGTNNIISKAQRNKAQRSFQPAKAQRKMRNLIFLLSEAQRNFRNELFDSVEAQRNSAIAERYFRTKLKRNLTSAIEISQHNANTAFLQF